jgi:hypothetical protein
VNVVKAARHEFRFLEDDYGCRAEESRSNWSEGVLYRNSTTFVSLTHDWRDVYTGVQLGPLVNGEVPEYPIFVQDEKTVSWVDLSYLLEANGLPLAEVSHRTKDVKADLAALAAAVRTHCGPLLGGDFSMHAKAVPLLLARADQGERELEEWYERHVPREAWRKEGHAIITETSKLGRTPPEPPQD